MGSAPERSEKPVVFDGKLDPTGIYRFTNLIGESVCLVGAWIIRIRFPNEADNPKAEAVIEFSGGMQQVSESFEEVIAILRGE